MKKIVFDIETKNVFQDVGSNPFLPLRGQPWKVSNKTSGRSFGYKLRSEGVKFLGEPYQLGDTRAVMIEGPSREALELVEVK